MARRVDSDQTVIHRLEPTSARRPSRGGAALEQRRGPGAPRSFALEAPELIVGRSADASVCIDSHLISRRHLLLRRVGPTYQALDLESSNGLFLDGVRIHSAVLFDGDELQLGDVLLVFRETGGGT